MRKFALIGIIIFIFSGCATAPFHMPVLSKTQKVDTFKAGVVQRAMVGEPMAVKASLLVKPGFIAAMDYQPPEKYNATYPLIRKDSIWICDDKFENGDYLCNNIAAGKPKNLGKHTWSGNYGLSIRPSGELYGFVGDAFAGEWPNIPKGLFRSTEVPYEVHFKQEIVYNGKKKDSIKILYREYKGNIARPAFSQDLTYDNSNSSIIGFRDIRIEVIEATNTDITFKVK